MTNKLYPPQIEGTIPAFHTTEKSKRLPVPFAMNRTVSWTEVAGFRVKMKSIQNNDLILYAQTEVTDAANLNKDTMVVYFDIPDKTLKVGMSYKVQLAYTDTSGKDGYFSTVGIVKYTAEPKLYIDGLDKGTLSSANNEYVGVYNQLNGDATEKVYSYRFDVRDNDGNIIETSGDLLHNHENDDLAYETHDTYSIKSNLEDNISYTIQYSVLTANGLEASTEKYRIIKQTTVDAEIEATLVAEMNEENGYVNLTLIGNKDSDGVEKTGTGTFLICRSSSEDSYGSWSEVCRFALYGDAPSNYNWRDFTVQHGYDYVYSLQQYNVDYGIYSNRMLSNTITANFEHSFLFDGERQLKIKYNPKVTSFKTTILEQKTNTLGGQYPFFFRNGNVNYKEFPISGLISYLADEEELFLTNDDLLLTDYSHLTREHTLDNNVKSTDTSYFYNMLDANYAYKLQEEYKKREHADSNENLVGNQRLRTTNLEDYNIMAERIFKLKVLDWLNDGKPKLFRSPGEGNYIVRLNNSSLTPDDKLSRMIHTFSTTATEIDDYNYNKLGDYNLLSIQDPTINQLRWATVLVQDLINNADENKIQISVENAEREYRLKVIEINEDDSLTSSEKQQALEELQEYYTQLIQKIQSQDDGTVSIGSENNLATLQCLDMVPGDRIHIYYEVTDKEPETIQIGITGAFYVEFDKSPVKVTIDRTCRQGQITYSYYGTSLHYFDTYRAINMSDFPVRQFIGSTDGADIIEQMQDIKYKVTKYNFLNFVKRPIEIAHTTEEMDNPLVVYLMDDEYYDSLTKSVINYQCKFWIDDKEVDLTETGNLYLSDFEEIPKVVLGNGVSLDVSVQRREIEYDVETKDAETAQAKADYINALWYLQNLIMPDELEYGDILEKVMAVQNETSDDHIIEDLVTKANLSSDEISFIVISSIDDYNTKMAKAKANVEITYAKFIEALVAALKAKEVLEIE